MLKLHAVQLYMCIHNFILFYRCLRWSWNKEVSENKSDRV